MLSLQQFLVLALLVFLFGGLFLIANPVTQMTNFCNSFSISGALNNFVYECFVDLLKLNFFDYFLAS